jgi:nitrite reductase/ring-hydroxylating ferredoxin subunit
MQPFNTTPEDGSTPAAPGRTLTLGEASHLPPGTFDRFELPDGEELAIYNIDGEYYATENFCPHKGALLSDGRLCGHVVECGWHGWQFDVRTGECLTVSERLRTYCVREQAGALVVEIAD